MKSTVNNINMAALDGQGRPSSALLRWLALFLGFFMIWVFIFVIAPWLQESPSVKPLAKYIDESGIDAGALYYTEVEETGEAEMNMRSTFEYTPKGGSNK